MKRIFLVLTISTLTFLQQNAMGQVQEREGPLLELKRIEFDFGEMQSGDKIEEEFWYFNKGNSPLVISNIITTCGCTATEWSKEALIPGDSATFQITFDSTGKHGRQNKLITIRSNSAEGDVRVRLFGMIVD